MTRILGVSASLRNARFGSGSTQFCDEIRAISSDRDLREYLEKQTKIRSEDFVAAGRAEGRAFDDIYDALQRLGGDRGLSNSEAALGAALWGAVQEGATINHVGLAPYFPPSGRIRNGDELKRRLLDTDAILLSGPVYFGDRGSLAQAFIEFLGADNELREHLRDKIYAGLAVGAKRNGGQETTLIYQMIDMANLGMLCVGNSSETTSQYGGTAVAGDVGTLWSDEYGIKTCVGTGQRIARVSKLRQSGSDATLRDPLRIDVWLLQDSADHHGRHFIENWVKKLTEKEPGLDLRVLDLTEENIERCIACDVCPTDVGASEEYRCIISTKRDLFARSHQRLIQADAHLIAAYSPRDRQNVNSVYQTFIERTRYWRRDNYVLGDRLVAPFVISEVGANQNLHIRMLTSAIRHHMVLHHPLIGFEWHGNVLNADELMEQGSHFVRNARQLVIGRELEGRQDDLYNPIGYVISKEKSEQDLQSGLIQRVLDHNLEQASRRKRVAS